MQVSTRNVVIGKTFIVHKALGGGVGLSELSTVVINRWLSGVSGGWNRLDEHLW